MPPKKPKPTKTIAIPSLDNDSDSSWEDEDEDDGKSNYYERRQTVTYQVQTKKETVIKRSKGRPKQIVSVPKESRRIPPPEPTVAITMGEDDEDEEEDEMAMVAYQNYVPQDVPPSPSYYPEPEFQQPEVQQYQLYSVVPVADSVAPVPTRAQSSSSASDDDDEIFCINNRCLTRLVFRQLACFILISLLHAIVFICLFYPASTRPVSASGYSSLSIISAIFLLLSIGSLTCVPLAYFWNRKDYTRVRLGSTLSLFACALVYLIVYTDADPRDLGSKSGHFAWILVLILLGTGSHLLGCVFPYLSHLCCEKLEEEGIVVNPKTDEDRGRRRFLAALGHGEPDRSNFRRASSGRPTNRAQAPAGPQASTPVCYELVPMTQVLSQASTDADYQDQLAQVERERQNQERRERERQNQERRERERQNQERREQERRERERQERERQARERQARERQNQERQARERQARERQARERQARERQARERQARERQARARQIQAQRPQVQYHLYNVNQNQYLTNQIQRPNPVYHPPPPPAPAVSYQQPQMLPANSQAPSSSSSAMNEALVSCILDYDSSQLSDSDDSVNSLASSDPSETDGY